ncbi:extracellular solute-binding protein [Catenuloplanes japonicus]|uniref:extracellular solute-binding protein n=1 Tax=Catenuloplanes japonicus TaxID=33876 RepID=UPI0005241A8F|nr:extracellular solute-binding protein [Catenuloplanes japonicus]
MELPYSRRSFIVGVLTCGSVTASATYLLSDPGPDITLRIGSGSDPSGGRELLIRQWNAMHREAKAEIIEFGTSTTDQRERLRDAARTHAVDIVNLDVIDVPAFAQDGLIEELDLSTPYLSKALETCRWNGRQYAVPFNSDVGVLYRRAPAGQERPGKEPVLLDFLGDASPGSLLMQLQPSNSASDEAFVVNVLELAQAYQRTLFDTNGRPAQKPPKDGVDSWNLLFTQIRTSVDAGRLLQMDTEQASTDAFNEDKADFLRNWPTAWPALEASRREKERGDRLDVLPLPGGVLGGQNLAVVSGGPHRRQALELITFLTSPESQKVLALHGFVPTHLGAYDDDVGVSRMVPHLNMLRDAVEGSRLRPMHPGYRAFSAVIREHAYAALWEDVSIERDFLNAMQQALS